MDIQLIGQLVGWSGLIATALGVVVAAARALIRGPKEDKSLETGVQDQIAGMAERWLAVADNRLNQAEARAEEAVVQAAESNKRAEAAEVKAEESNKRAEAAEATAENLSHRVTELERNLHSALNTIGILWPWGLNGGGEPVPKLESWIMEWLHRENKGT